MSRHQVPSRIGHDGSSHRAALLLMQVRKTAIDEVHRGFCAKSLDPTRQKLVFSPINTSISAGGDNSDSDDSSVDTGSDAARHILPLPSSPDHPRCRMALVRCRVVDHISFQKSSLPEFNESSRKVVSPSVILTPCTNNTTYQPMDSSKELLNNSISLESIEGKPGPPPDEPRFTTQSDDVQTTRNQTGSSKLSDIQCLGGSASELVGRDINGGQQVRGILRKKFAWKNFPELEAYLIRHRPQYLRYSSELNYTPEQKRYNNRLTQGLLELAASEGYVFEDFTFAAVRDRIRCYYKSYVQAAKKKKRKKESK